jgi:Uma2 family endonuclease
MPDPYEELIDGETFIRGPLNAPHELLCDRLHSWVSGHLPANSALKLLPRRTVLTLRAGTDICPDLALVRRDNNELYLAAEVLQPGDHHPDTVLKKQLYSDCRVPRLWVVDSRYQNVEVYATGGIGFRLDTILAVNDSLTDAALSGGAYAIDDIFSRR